MQNWQDLDPEIIEFLLQLQKQQPNQVNAMFDNGMVAGDSYLMPDAGGYGIHTPSNQSYVHPNTDSMPTLLQALENKRRQRSKSLMMDEDKIKELLGE